MIIDREFHQVLLRRSPSRYASKFADILRTQLQPTEIRYYQQQFPKKIAAVADHTALIEALNAEKIKKAGRLARRHRMKQARAWMRFWNSVSDMGLERSAEAGLFLFFG